MLSHAKLPKSFWREVARTAIDIVNLLPVVPLHGAILEKIYSKQKVSYNHLKVFSYRAFVHTPKDERAKLDSKTRECIYLRSPRDEFGYRLWDPISRRIIRSRDVVFFRDQTIEDLKKEKSKHRVVRDFDTGLSPMAYDNSGDDTTKNNNETSSNDNPTSSFKDDDEQEGQDELVDPMLNLPRRDLKKSPS